ncbi:hypothetical protein EVAR_102608_1 [Eumeta japonica]|uniref:Uncharacterized protein n=1 Tax=Eumeta variegata TaxID=151549 RepID=A0A4C1TUS9_EUMVA|nr:hypothetical protein EVAR_102608_1 [Eumeta japonica]
MVLGKKKDVQQSSSFQSTGEYLKVRAASWPFRGLHYKPEGSETKVPRPSPNRSPTLRPSVRARARVISERGERTSPPHYHITEMITITTPRPAARAGAPPPSPAHDTAL